MKSTISLIIMYFLIIIGSKGQCSKAVFTKKEKATYKSHVKSRVEKNIAANRITIIGGYIHEGDSVKLWKCSNDDICSSEILNENVYLDGVSFETSFSFEEGEKSIFLLELDSCHYFINVPEKIGMIFIEKVTPDLNIDFY